MYIIENSFVYQVEKTEHFEVKAGIGQETRIELISENDVEKLYEYQKLTEKSIRRTKVGLSYLKNYPSRKLKLKSLKDCLIV